MDIISVKENQLNNYICMTICTMSYSVLISKFNSATSNQGKDQ